MSVSVSSGGGYVEAKELYVANAGAWVKVPLGVVEWTRPEHWLPNTVTAGEQKIQVLARIGGVGAAVTEQQITIIAQGAYTVDWGDGTAAQNFASNITATHQYDPTALTGADFEPGYKQALITITPQSGNLTLFSLNGVYVAGKTYRTSAVEIIVGPSTLTTFSVFNSSLLERVELKSRLTLASGINLFTGTPILREIAGEIAITGTTLSGMFSGCYLLTKYPTLIISPTVTNGNAMFTNNASMVEMPPMPTAQLTIASSMFAFCYQLKKLTDDFNMGLVANASSMFQACMAMREFPLLNTASVTGATSMFSTCIAVREIHLTSTAAMTNVNGMFSGCAVLGLIDTLDFAAVTPASSLTNTFLGLSRLAKIVWAAGKGPKFSFALPTIQDAAGLNDTYTNLPTITAQTITVTSVPGGAGDNPAIATAKGWTVTGS